MPTSRSRATVALVAAGACLVLTAALGAQKIKVQSNRDEKTDFAAVKSYAWLPSPPLKTDTAPDAVSDPTLTQEVMGPHIVAAADRELAARGLTRLEKATGEPDVRVVSYAALSVGVNASELGSYYRYTLGWSLPAVSPSTTSYEILERGTVVIDMLSRGGKTAIWRGSATTEINRENTLPKRIQRVNEAVARMFERFPVPRTRNR